MERIKKTTEGKYYLLTFSDNGIFISIKEISKQEYENKYKDTPLVKGDEK